MKTMLFCTSYVDDRDFYNNSKRIERWIDYYKSKMDDLGVDALFLIDDGSPLINTIKNAHLYEVDNLPTKIDTSVNIMHFKDNLGRPKWDEYVGWWRSFLFSLNIAEKFGYEKIIHIESDFYVVNDRIMEYFREVKQGWTSLYSPFHGFPETAIQIICKDQFLKFKRLSDEVTSNGFLSPDLVSAELYIPFTKVEKSFTGDRIGQPEVFDHWMKHYKKGQNLDYLGQIHSSQRVGHYRIFFDITYDF